MSFQSENLFAQPRKNLNRDDCFFYHVCDIPDVGTVGGHWDLRDTIEDYLGHFDFSGQSVLDIGTASGYLTFEMEKRGASVVSFDVLDETVTEIVPFWNDPLKSEAILAAQHKGFERLKNSYWYCHEHFASKAKAYYGNIYHLPESLGKFDAIMIGMCLPHIRDQLGALESITKLAKKTVIITQQTLNDERPIMQMIAQDNSENMENLRFAWWLMSDGCIKNFMGILGFKLKKMYKAKHKCVAYNPERYEECTSFIFQK
ncbi:class I SAM-dependent methyltransferase [Coleofasciculus sp. H7-2]|uniref:class I SAM-dependent methyltransferase n=1 Tax=Coleofasciculus sp. H7-2 TaxID=3351545 RepID=UPI00366B20A4